MINSKSLIDRFFDYVKIDSESCRELEICSHIEEELKEIGGKLYTDQSSHGIDSNGYNLLAHFSGSQSQPSILLCAHLDTVNSGKAIKPLIEGDRIISEGATILGSDDKSGVAAIMEAINYIKKNNIPHRPFEVLFTICEEIGLLGSSAFDYMHIRSKQAIVFDSSESFGSIVNEAPGVVIAQVKIKGKSAHAAIHPEDGIHALKIAAHAIASLSIGRFETGSTLNVANLIAEGKTNTISAEASFDFEIRSFSDKDLQNHLDNTIEQIQKIARENGADCKIETEHIIDHFHIDDQSDVLIELFKCFKNLSLTPTLTRTYGGSDTCNLNKNGIQSVNVSTGMTNVHSVDEFIKIEHLETTAAIVLSLLTESSIAH